MRSSALWRITLVATFGLSFLALPLQSAADVGPAQHPHFPKPPLLEPNVAFWKQVYTEHGVGDFVLHDRDNLGVIYAVIRVPENGNQIRAATLAKPEIERTRDAYRDILFRLADGVMPEELGAEGRRVAAMWGCPCSPGALRRAGDNIRAQQGLREKVLEGLHRAQGLLPRIVTILRRHDVPVELAALPLVESTFNPKAYSKAGASGLWQFIRSTGRQYSLVTRRQDHRRDPLRATEAAAKLLRNNYEALGSWPLAIVAYNHGHAGIRAASAMVGSTAIEDIIARYDGPRFGFASKNFYAEFLAALDLVHPYLAGHGKPLNPKGRRQAVEQASLRNQPSAAANNVMVPPVAVEPAETIRPSELLPPSVEPPAGDAPTLVESNAGNAEPQSPAVLPSSDTEVVPASAGDETTQDARPNNTPVDETPETEAPPAG